MRDNIRIGGTVEARLCPAGPVITWLVENVVEDRVYVFSRRSGLATCISRSAVVSAR